MTLPNLQGFNPEQPGRGTHQAFTGISQIQGPETGHEKRGRRRAPRGRAASSQLSLLGQTTPGTALHAGEAPKPKEEVLCITQRQTSRALVGTRGSRHGSGTGDPLSTALR